MKLANHRSIHRARLAISSELHSTVHVRPLLTVKRSFSEQTTPAEPKKGGLLEKWIGFDANFASKDFKYSRWLMTLPAIGSHMCIGAPYAWSLMADQVTREHGFVAAAASDWTLAEAALPLSIVFILQGLSAAVFGNWQARVGVRKSMALAACCFGGGLMLGALGIHLHSLPLLYAGYGVLGGTGIGIGYTPPVQALLQWFPDKKGIASGICIASFGSSALLFAPCVQYLMKQYAKMPEYLGPVGKYATQVVDGKLFASVSDNLVEVVQVGAAELAKISYPLSEGLYVVGSGSTGAAEALATMGAGYFTLITLSSMFMKRPHPSYTVAGATTAAATSTPAPVPVREVSVAEAVKTPQFYQLGIAFFCIATGGMGLFSVAKPMMSDVFSTLLPAVVTSAFAGQYVLMLSSGNLGGRLAWASISDMIGRRKVFNIFTFTAVPLYFALPTMVDKVVTTGSTIPLLGFCASTVAVISFMGGTYAILPAYEADLFGNNNVGPIHGRMLIFSSAAALAGPAILLKLRSMSELNVINDMLSKVNPDAFLAKFGAPIEKASELISAKTLSISKLMTLMPPGTLDPTPHIYDSTMYTLGGLMAVALISHAMVKPLPVLKVVDVKEALKDAPKEEEVAGSREVKK